MTHEFLRGQSVYNRLINDAVDENCVWKINSLGTLMRGRGMIAAVQQVVKILAEHKVPFSYVEIGADVRAEVVKREEMMRANTIDAANKKLTDALTAIAEDNRRLWNNKT